MEPAPVCRPAAGFSSSMTAVYAEGGAFIFVTTPADAQNALRAQRVADASHQWSAKAWSTTPMPATTTVTPTAIADIFVQ